MQGTKAVAAGVKRPSQQHQHPPVALSMPSGNAALSAGDDGPGPEESKRPGYLVGVAVGEGEGQQAAIGSVVCTPELQSLVIVHVTLPALAALQWVVSGATKPGGAEQTFLAKPRVGAMVLAKL